MCDPSFNKPWSRTYTLWRHQGPQKDILPRAPQNLSAALETSGNTWKDEDLESNHLFQIVTLKLQLFF